MFDNDIDSGHRRGGIRLVLITLAGLTLANAAQAADQIPQQLIGSWSFGYVSLLREVNPVNGITIRPTTSAGSNYEFHPDGTYRHALLMESGSGMCVIKTFVYQEGTFAISGGTITLRASKNIHTYGGCGKESSTNDKGARVQTEQWSLEQDPNNRNRMMLIIGTSTYRSGG